MNTLFLPPSLKGGICDESSCRVGVAVKWRESYTEVRWSAQSVQSPSSFVEMVVSTLPLSLHVQPTEHVFISAWCVPTHKVVLSVWAYMCILVCMCQPAGQDNAQNVFADVSSLFWLWSNPVWQPSICAGTAKLHDVSGASLRTHTTRLCVNN